MFACLKYAHHVRKTLTLLANIKSGSEIVFLFTSVGMRFKILLNAQKVCAKNLA